MPDKSNSADKATDPRADTAPRKDETDADRAQAGAGSSANERATESRPRGKTEDPDRTL